MLKKAFIRRGRFGKVKTTRLGCKTIKCKSGKGKSTRLRCKKALLEGGRFGKVKNKIRA